MARRIRAEVPEYEAAGPGVVADLESLAVETSQLLGAMLAGQIDGDREDLAAIRRGVARRVGQGIELEPFLHAYRVAQGEYWEACSRQARLEKLSGGPALALGSRLHEAMDKITAHATEGYLREELRVSGRTGRAVRDLVERLISGRGAEVGRRPLAAPGLDLDAELLVAVARIEAGSRSVEESLESLRVAFDGEMSGRVRPLLALREGELVAIAPAAGDRGTALRTALEAARRSVTKRLGLDVRIGLGAPAGGAESVARGYRDSLLALSFTTPARPVLSLDGLGSLQAALAGADLTTRQVIASRGAALAALPEPTRALIAEAVRALAAASLNIAAAAEALGLHPNTLRYRLARIAEQTGHDPRTLDGLVELVCVIEAQTAA